MLSLSNLRFPRQYFDGETGLNQNWHRDYDPTVGRYGQSDLVGLIGGINTYVYVNSNSINRIDPDGLQAFPMPLPIPSPGVVDGSGDLGFKGLGGTNSSSAGSQELDDALGGSGSGIAMSNSGDSAARQVEYDAYKRRCNEPPPPELSPCDLAQWKLSRNKQCRDMRQAWDNKWSPGRHAGDIANLDRGIQKLEQ